mgnify:CR=1 FL=1
MISAKDLRDIASARLADSEVLRKERRFDGATYLCGYVVELTLKARICDTLKWAGFPQTRSEFENYRSFRTHSLDVLLSLTGVERDVKTKCFAEWSIVVKWDPEVRYKPIGTAKEQDADLMIESTKALLAII